MNALFLPSPAPTSRILFFLDLLVLYHGVHGIKKFDCIRKYRDLLVFKRPYLQLYTAAA
jgi:hypothetical protein